MTSEVPPPPSPLLPPPLRGGTPGPGGSPPAGRDPEFDPIVPEGALEGDLTSELFQRLVANPFLGIAAILAWLAGLSALILHRFAGPFTLMALVLMLASLALVPGLFQYHCLDCGKSGRLSGWRGHLCPRVAERRLEGRVRRLRGPTPPVQVVLWLWFLMFLFLFAQSAGFRIPPTFPRNSPVNPPQQQRARRLEPIGSPLRNMPPPTSLLPVEG